MWEEKSGIRKIWSCHVARRCPRLRFLRLHGIDRAERSATLPQRCGNYTRAHTRHGAAARLPSRRARSLFAPPPQPDDRVLAYDLSDPFCIPVVRGIQEGLQPVSYLPLLMDAQTQRRLFDNYLQMILERRAEGVIVIASWIFEETNLLARHRKEQCPYRDCRPRSDGPQVSSAAGGQPSWGCAGDAASHLPRPSADRGNPRPRGVIRQRAALERVSRAAAEAGIQIDPRLVFQLPNLSTRFWF